MYEIPPSLANVCEFVPPLFASPLTFPFEMDFDIQNGQPIEIKYIKKGIIIEDVDRCSMYTVARGLCLLTS
jgi:hypothetical protein